MQQEAQWYKAKLLPPARGLFTASFYPLPKKRTGAQYVYFTETKTEILHKKVILASKLEASSLRVVTYDLASKCLLPGLKASKAEMAILNNLAEKLKL